MIPPVVDVAWLTGHPQAVIADVRWYLDGRSGAQAYAAGHIPGAIFIDLDAELAAPASPDAGRTEARHDGEERRECDAVVRDVPPPEVESPVAEHEPSLGIRAFGRPAGVG